MMAAPRVYPIVMGEYDLLRELGKGAYGQYVRVVSGEAFVELYGDFGRVPRSLASH
jgi:hypothetical protein